MTQRFFKNRLYHFKGERWVQSLGQRESYEIVVRGDVVRVYVDVVERDRDCLGEWQEDRRLYRIDDGHLPDYQPRVESYEVNAKMRELHARMAWPLPETLFKNEQSK